VHTPKEKSGPNVFNTNCEKGGGTLVVPALGEAVAARDSVIL